MRRLLCLALLREEAAELAAGWRMEALSGYASPNPGESSPSMSKRLRSCNQHTAVTACRRCKVQAALPAWCCLTWARSLKMRLRLDVEAIIESYL